MSGVNVGHSKYKLCHYVGQQKTLCSKFWYTHLQVQVKMAAQLGSSLKVNRSFLKRKFDQPNDGPHRQQQQCKL